MEDAVDRAIALANLDPHKVRVVKYERPSGLFDSMLFGSDAHTTLPSAQLDLSALADLATPCAYLLFTWLPALVSNQVALERVFFFCAGGVASGRGFRVSCRR